MKVYFFLMWFAMVTILAYFTGYQAAQKKYERKGKWYAAELENPVHYEEGKACVSGFRWTADENGKVLSLSAFIYDDDMSPLYDGKAVAVPSENQPATWPEAADLDMKIELKY